MMFYSLDKGGKGTGFTNQEPVTEKGNFHYIKINKLLSIFIEVEDEITVKGASMTRKEIRQEERVLLGRKFLRPFCIYT